MPGREGFKRSNTPESIKSNTSEHSEVKEGKASPESEPDSDMVRRAAVDNAKRYEYLIDEANLTRKSTKQKLKGLIMSEKGKKADSEADLEAGLKAGRKADLQEQGEPLLPEAAAQRIEERDKIEAAKQQAMASYGGYVF